MGWMTRTHMGDLEVPHLLEMFQKTKFLETPKRWFFVKS